MQNTPPKRPPVKNGKPRLRLPFEKRKMDFATWSYVHRAGLCITIIAFLVFGIAFVSCKIRLKSEPKVTTIYMDFEPDKPEEREKPQIMQDLQPYDYSDVSNRASNENSEQNANLNANLRDAQGTNAGDLYDEAGRLGDQMARNRAAFEAGVRAQEDLLNSRGRRETGGEERQQDARVDGKVTVSYSFANPVRNKEMLVVPAYMCQGGGTVVVDATLDVNGYVVAATVNRSSSTTDECMRSTAVKAALGSRFNLDLKAPAKHRGTITYVFIPQ